MEKGGWVWVEKSCNDEHFALSQYHHVEKQGVFLYSPELDFSTCNECGIKRLVCASRVFRWNLPSISSGV